MIKLQHLTLLVSLAIALPAIAADGWELRRSDPNSDFHSRLPEPMIDDVSQDDKENIRLNAGQKHHAKVWALTDEQEKRYVLLMSGKSGWYYKNRPLTPIEILAINARSNDERLSLTKKSVEQDAQRIAKELAFNAVWNQVRKSYWKSMMLKPIREFNMKKYSPYQDKKLGIRSGDQLLLFAKVEHELRIPMSKIVKKINQTNSIRLKVYLVSDKNAHLNISRWIKLHGLRSEHNLSKKIEVLQGDKAYANLKNQPKMPALYLIREGKSKLISINRL